MLSHFSHVRLFATLCTVAWQAPQSMRFTRWEYWSGLPCSSPGDLPNPKIKPTSPATLALQVDSLSTEPPGSPWESNLKYTNILGMERRLWTYKGHREKVRKLKEEQWHGSQERGSRREWFTLLDCRSPYLRASVGGGGWGQKPLQVF